MLIFSVSFQFYRMIPEGNPSQTSVQRDRKRNEEKTNTGKQNVNNMTKVSANPRTAISLFERTHGECSSFPQPQRAEGVA